MSAILLNNLLGALVIQDSLSWEKADSIKQKVSDLAEAIEHSGLNPDVRQEMLKHLFMIESLRDISTPKHGVAEGVASGEPTTTQEELQSYMQVTRDQMPHFNMQHNRAGEYELRNTGKGVGVTFVYTNPWEAGAHDLIGALTHIGYDAERVIFEDFRKDSETLMRYLKETFGCAETGRYPWRYLEFNVHNATMTNTHSGESYPLKSGADTSMLLQVNYNLRKLGFEISDVKDVKKPQQFANTLHNLGALVIQ